MSKVITRYAPSPTGVPHIGNIRTALYNFLFARAKGGGFILRIEDTDKKREVRESVSKIEESLKILGIDWDNKYFQSERLPIYKKNLEILKDANLVYEDEGSWRFRVAAINQNKEEKISWVDLVHGSVQFPVGVVEDFVIIKSDGFPTYHFASVVDDHQMEISHVIRGDEWISSTPKHLLLYRAFGWNPPSFVHVPSILGHDRKKLSKREGAKSVLEYVEEGYLPQALVNFLALLGWAPKGDRELFTLGDLIREFSLERLNKNSPIFNQQKLDWFNKKYIQTVSGSDLARLIKSRSIWAKNLSGEKLIKILNLARDRIVTLNDFDKVALIFFEKGKEKPPQKSKVENARAAIESISVWNEQQIAKALGGWIEIHKLEANDFKNTLRLCVFADNTPPIYQSLFVLGREEVKRRIDDAIKKSK